MQCSAMMLLLVRSAHCLCVLTIAPTTPTQPNYSLSRAHPRPPPHYDPQSLRKHAPVLAGSCDLLVCDEGHRLKSSAGSKTIDALLSLGCQRRVVLTGTPVQNKCAGAHLLLTAACFRAVWWWWGAGAAPQYDAAADSPLLLKPHTLYTHLMNAQHTKTSSPPTKNQKACPSFTRCSRCDPLLLRRTQNDRLARRARTN